MVNSGTTGTWTDETDIRPTLMYLAGLKDDYEHDGRVVTQLLADPDHALGGPGVAALGACYKQLNSSVGQFGDYTLRASTAAVESSTPTTASSHGERRADRPGPVRDALALRIKGELEAAAFGGQPIVRRVRPDVACQAIIAAAECWRHPPDPRPVAGRHPHQVTARGHVRHPPRARRPTSPSGRRVRLPSR